MLAGLAGYEEDLAFLQMRLNTLKQALVVATQRGDPALVEDVKTRYRTILGQLDALRRSVSGREMPSAFMQSLARTSDDILRTGSQITGAVGGVLSGVGMTARLLPFILIGALVVLGIGFSKGSLGVQVRRD